MQNKTGHFSYNGSMQNKAKHFGGGGGGVHIVYFFPSFVNKG